MATAHQLWSGGTVFDPNLPTGVDAESGRTSIYGIGQSLVFVPFDMVGSLLEMTVASNNWYEAYIRELPVVLLYIPLITVLWCWLTYQLCRRFGLRPNLATVAVVLFFVATPAGFYMTQTAQEEALVGVLVSGALLCVLKWGDFGIARYALYAGLLCGFAVVVRVNTIFALLVPVAILVHSVCNWRFPRKLMMNGLLAFGFGSILMLLLFAMFNVWRYGGPFTTGYSIYLSNLPEGSVLTDVRLSVAIALLFGLGKGLFVLAPILLVSISNLPLKMDQRAMLLISSLVAVVCSALFHSKIIGFADGSESWGPRYQIHLTGLLIIPVAIAMEKIVSFRHGKTLILCLAVIGIFNSTMAIMAPESLEYFQLRERNGQYGEELLLGVRDGQLASRARNLKRLIEGDEFCGNEDSEWCQPITRMSNLYMPNLWGPVFSKRFPDSTIGLASLVSWLTASVLALWLATYWAWAIRKARR